MPGVVVLRSSLFFLWSNLPRIFNADVLRCLEICVRILRCGSLLLAGLTRRSCLVSHFFVQVTHLSKWSRLNYGYWPRSLAAALRPLRAHVSQLFKLALNRGQWARSLVDERSTDVATPGHLRCKNAVGVWYATKLPKCLGNTKRLDRIHWRT